MVLVVVLAEEVVLAVDLEVQAAVAAALVVALLHPVAVAELDWLVVEVAAAGVAADLLSLLLAWPPLPVPVWLQLAVWLLWLPLWLWCRWLCWLLLLLVLLLLHAAGILFLCLSANGFGPYSS